MDVEGDCKYGGNALLTNSSLTATLTKYGTDTYIKWSWIRFGRKRTTDVLLVQLYVVQENFGTFTPATQEYIQCGYIDVLISKVSKL